MPPEKFSPMPPSQETLSLTGSSVVLEGTRHFKRNISPTRNSPKIKVHPWASPLDPSRFGTFGGNKYILDSTVGYSHMQPFPLTIKKLQGSNINPKTSSNASGDLRIENTLSQVTGYVISKNINLPDQPKKVENKIQNLTKMKFSLGHSVKDRFDASAEKNGSAHDPLEFVKEASLSNNTEKQKPKSIHVRLPSLSDFVSSLENENIIPKEENVTVNFKPKKIGLYPKPHVVTSPFVLEGNNPSLTKPKHTAVSLPSHSPINGKDIEAKIEDETLEIQGSHAFIHLRSESDTPVDDRGSFRDSPISVAKLCKSGKKTKELSPNVDQCSNLSEATKRLLSEKNNVIKLQNLPTITLPALAVKRPTSTAHVVPRFPPLRNEKSPTRMSNFDPKPLGIGHIISANERKNFRETLNETLSLRPEVQPDTIEADTITIQSDSFSVRKDYGQNLERSWYQQRLEKLRAQEEAKRVDKIFSDHKLDKTLDDFYKSFYSSGSDTDDDVPLNIDTKESLSDGGTASNVQSPLIRFASTDVLLSDYDSNSESDIEVYLKDSDVLDRRVKYKMRKLRHRREAKYQHLLAPELEIQKKLDEFMDGSYMLSDTEIRAMRLKLKKQDNGEEFKENMTIEELKAEVMRALNRLNGTKSRGRRKKKSKNIAKDGDGEYQKQSMYERFLKEYGFLLDGYSPDPVSESDTEESDDENNDSNSKSTDLGSTTDGVSKSQSFKLPQLNLRNSPNSMTQGVESGDNTDNETIHQHYTEKKRKIRIRKVLKKLQKDREKLLEGAEKTFFATPRSSRRSSDPVIHNGRILVAKRYINVNPDIIEEVDEDAENNGARKKKKKGKSKLNTRIEEIISKRRLESEMMFSRNGVKRDRPSSSSGQLEWLEDEFTFKPLRRTNSFRFFKPRTDKDISLRELTKGYDFPGKDVKIQIAERRLRRQRLRKGKKSERTLKEIMDDKNREERRKIIAEAKAEYLRHLEKAREEQRKAMMGSRADLTSSQENIKNRSLKMIKSKMLVRRRSNGLIEELNPKPDYKALVNDSPFESSGVSWSYVKSPSRNLADDYKQHAEDKINMEAGNISELLLEMKDCRYIRWTRAQQMLVDYVNALELEELDNTIQDEYLSD